MNFYFSSDPILQSQINLLNVQENVQSISLDCCIDWLLDTNLTETVFDYIPECDVPPCVNFLGSPTTDKVFVLSISVEHISHFSMNSESIAVAYDLKFDHFNGMPKTHLNELELAWIGIEETDKFIIVNNNQINGAFFPFLTRRQVRDIHKFLLNFVEKYYVGKNIIIPHHSTLRKFVERISKHPNRSIRETPYSSTVVKGYTKQNLSIQTKANDLLTSEELVWWVKKIENS